jgi:hypothetical protein
MMIIIMTQNRFSPVDSVTTIRHNTQMHTSHKITNHSQTKHSTQCYIIMNDILPTMTKMQTNKAILVRGLGGLWGCVEESTLSN